MMKTKDVIKELLRIRRREHEEYLKYDLKGVDDTERTIMDLEWILEGDDK